jgi:hypothetical protein
MAEKKNYNRLALQGIDIDDMEFVNEFNLDINVAYTPKINDVLLNRMYNANVEGYMKQGMPESKARSKAGQLRAKAKAQINELLA